MKQYDLTEAISGASLCTRSNKPVSLYHVGQERIVCYAGRRKNALLFISADKLTGRLYPDKETPNDIFLTD